MTHRREARVIIQEEWVNNRVDKRLEELVHWKEECELSMIPKIIDTPCLGMPTMQGGARSKI